MAHEIETMAYAGETPWHGLGTFVGAEDVLSPEMLQMSGLSWEVQLRQMTTTRTDGSLVVVPNHRSVIRVTDGTILGVVGSTYRPLQNMDAFTFLDSLVEEGLMRYHTAGSLRGGQRVWVLAKVANAEIVPGDKHDHFILLFNTHDGSGALRVLWVTVRVVCANTARAALAQGKKGSGVSIRHTKNMMKRVNEARKVLGLGRKVFDKAVEFERALAGAKATYDMWETFANALIPNPSTTTAKSGNVSTKRAEAKRELLEECLVSSMGQDIPVGIKGCLVRDTLYGFRNAVTNYVNYEKQTRNNEGQGQELRFESSLFGDSARMVEQADDLLVEMLAA